jgi:hypothetical protein
MKKSVYLDLENPADLAKLDDPLAFFSLHEDELICLDEISVCLDFAYHRQDSVDSGKCARIIMALF